MDQINSLENTLTDATKDVAKLYNNLDEGIKMIVKLLLVLYAGLVAPKIGDFARPLFDNVIFKIVFFFALVYVGNQDPTLSLLMAVAFVLTLMYLKRQEQQKENFSECAVRPK